MKTLFTATMMVFAAAFATNASAAERTIKLSVPGMTCASCPYIVKTAIARLDGVRAVKAAMADRSATVTFEDTLTSVAAIRQATANAGYPATIFEDKSS